MSKAMMNVGEDEDVSMSAGIMKTSTFINYGSGAIYFEKLVGFLIFGIFSF